ARRRTRSGHANPSSAVGGARSEHQALALAAALAALTALDVAIEYFDRVVLHEARTAATLHGLLGETHWRFRRQQRSRGGFAWAALALVQHPSGPIQQQARCIDVGCHIDELVLDRLELRNGSAELFAGFRIAERRVVGALRHPQGQSADGDAAPIQRLQAVYE